MIDVYTANTPNGVKVTIMLEELGVPYTLHMLNLSAQDQKKPKFLKINPNGRIPAIVDHDAASDTSIAVFESGAILLYLAEKYGRLLPADPAARIDAIAWTYFQTGGIGPMMGQAGYFKRNFPEMTQAYERFYTESERLVSVMESVLKERSYLAGADYSIADIMHYGWIDRGSGYFALDLAKFPAVTHWLERLSKRAGVQKGQAVLQS